ncbi:aldehyde ferredoxin oxidoreductase family protein [Pyrolobus fumarii]|nr:aldehyde ferredoxin oxidoreductase family protein [Pyrolobus fumarii]
MGSLPGYAGRIAVIDLSESEVSILETPGWLRELFVGGKGFAYALVARYAPFSTSDPLYDPSNVVVVAAGALTGVAPGSSKVAFAARSPLTNMICDSYSGQVFAAKLRYAGFDALVLKGVSPEPVYIYVESGKVEIRSASHIWGAYVSDVTETLWRETKRGASIAAIGPGGEKLVRYANVMIDGFRAAGRCGIGAVLGYKRVKAIVVYGGRRPTLVNEDEWRKTYIDVYKSLQEHPAARYMSKYGTNNGVVTCSKWSMCPGKHWMIPSPSRELVEKMSGKAVLAREVGKEVYSRYAGIIWGWGCPVKCSKLVKPQLKGFEHLVVKPEYEHLTMLGVIFNIYDVDEVLRLEWLVNNLGLDSISFGETAAWLIELYENGLVRKEELDGLTVEPKFGDPRVAEELAKLVAERRGIGAILAEGVERASRILGRGEDRAVHVKGLESAAWDPRGRRAMALSYATADVGASHLRGWPEPHSKPSDGPAEEMVESLINDRDWKALMDALGLCAFVPYDRDQVDKLLRVTLGRSFDEVWPVGARTEAIARIYGALVGRVPEGDTIPKRWMEPIPDGPLKGEKAFRDWDEFRRALLKFYKLRGYDEKLGIPKRETLEKLGLTKLEWLMEAWRRAWEEVERRISS